MFSVVGLTLEQVSSGTLPQTRLADTLDRRTSQRNFQFAPGAPVVIYSTEGADTQALIARTKYKEKGQFLVFLYFNEVAVEACKEMGIPIQIVDHLHERELPTRRTTLLERPYLAPVKSLSR